MGTNQITPDSNPRLNKISAKITKQNIVIAHRVGRFEGGKTRQFILKFVSNIHKREAIYHRRKLRGTGLGPDC